MLFQQNLAQAQTCPSNPTPTITSPQPPADVCIPEGFSANPIQFFDDYSWRAFIAMVWPAAQGQRGVPDPNKTPKDQRGVSDMSQSSGAASGPLVFETFKADWEVFQPDGHAPSKWEEIGGIPTNPCQADVTAPGFSDMILASTTKFQNLRQAGFHGSLVGPLVAQNRTYVRYLTSFNQLEFNQILNNQWYLRENLKNGISFSNQSIDLKTSWIDMTNVPQPERFYTRKAWLMDASTNKCAETIVGLVGMHIVQKTRSRPEWIWSSFEHIDNVPQTTPPNLGPTTFNNGDGTPLQVSNPITESPLPETPTPFNVTRIKPIFDSAMAGPGEVPTVSTNAAYRDALEGSVWANYQLVMTQWPLQEADPTILEPPKVPKPHTFPDPTIPGSPPHTFPGSILGSSTTFSNTTMETFEQRSIFGGCMNCHNDTMKGTDFLWALEINAFPIPPSTVTAQALGAPHAMAMRATMGTPALNELQTLLESLTAPSKQ